jgi:hypothetical protein
VVSNIKALKERSFKYKPTPKSFRKKGEQTHGEGRHHPHKVGDRISFSTPKGRKTGKIVVKHKEYYIVKSGKKLLKINRNSALYQLGTFATANRGINTGDGILMPNRTVTPEGHIPYSPYTPPPTPMQSQLQIRR